MSSRPAVFIGSSSEGLAVAKTLQAEVDQFADATLWTQGIFRPSLYYLESLSKALETADFAVLVLTPDDITESRGTRSSSARDNVVFELGLFIGHLGRHRCVFVHDRSSLIKLPSDLLGIVGETFATRADGNLSAALGPICRSIELKVREFGVRAKLLKFTHQDLQTNTSLPDLSGDWAGYSPDGPEPDEQSSTLTIHQLGSFIQANIIYKTKDGERLLESEGRFSSGQLVLFFEDVKGRGYIVGTIVLHLASDLRSLKGQSLYYRHTKDAVISRERLYVRM